MPRRKKQRTNFKLPVDLQLLEKLAPKLVHPAMFTLVQEDFKLKASSGIWRKLDGSLTARFVWRDPEGGSFVVSVRNIRLPAMESVG
jgi:hypothetical protein